MEIAPGIYSMTQRKGAYVHAFLLDDGDGLTLVDTLYDSDAHRILAELARIGKSVSDIKRIVMTHCHRSHLGGLALLKEQSGAPVYCHEWEADLIAGQRKQQPVSWRPYTPVQVWPLQVALNLGVANITAQGWLKERQVLPVSTCDATNRPGSSASGSSEHAVKQR